MADNTTTKSLEAKCYCGSVNFIIDVPVDVLPLPVHLCHCSMCRYRAGTPCVFHTGLPASIQPRFISPSTKENVTSYGAKGTSSSWNFCSTCGCHIGSMHYSTNSWTLSSSIFLDHGPENFSIVKHIYAGSTGDGGLACMLPEIGGRKVEVWDAEDGVPDAGYEVPGKEIDENGTERLRAKCHCGGVSFTIGRPTDEDLEDSYLSSYISPLDPSKWIASYDICNDCRVITGNHIVGWAFLPLASCKPTIETDLRIGTSKTYSSSQGVLRSFCGTCGATVFYSCRDRSLHEGKEVIDLATGILRAPEGVMANKWLTWRTRISGPRYDAAFAQAIQDGMKEWTLSKYGKELDFDIN